MTGVAVRPTELEDRARVLHFLQERWGTERQVANGDAFFRRGFVLAALRPNAVERSRRLKPEIPTIGEDGIPLRDELELEKRLL